jgi:hypothetical protein
MGVGRAKLMVGIAVLAIALFPGEAGVAQQLPSVPSLPSTPNLPPAPNLPSTPPVQAPSTPSLPAPDVSAPEVPVPDVSAPDVSAPALPTPRLPSTPSTPQLPTPQVGTDAVRTPGSSSGQASGPGSTGAQTAGAGQAAAAGADGGPGAPQARSDVARMLNTGVRRVARLEQQALTALGTDGPGAACSTGTALLEVASGGVFDLLGLDEGGFDTGSGSDATAQIAGQSETGGQSQSEAQSNTTPVSRLPLGLPAGSAAQLGWLFALVMIVFFVAGVLKELFTRRDARSTPELVARRR